RQVGEQGIAARVQSLPEKRLQVAARLRLQPAEVRVEPAQEQRPPFRVRLARPEAAHQRFLEDVVAAEDLIRAFASKHYLEAVVAYLAREQVERRRRRAQHRPLGMPDDLLEARRDVATQAAQRRVIGAQRLDQRALI